MPPLPDPHADARIAGIAGCSALGAAQAGLWRTDGERLRYSTSAARILGFPSADRIAGLPLAVAAASIHPEDRLTFTEQFKALHLEGGAVRMTFRTALIGGLCRIILMQGRFEEPVAGRHGFGHGLVMNLSDDLTGPTGSTPESAALLTCIDLILAARRTLQTAGPAPSAPIMAVDSLLMLLGRQVAANLSRDAVT